MSSPLVSYLARKWRVDVNTGTTGSPVWVQVKGITNLTPGTPTTTQDSSDYDSDGWGADEKTMLKWNLGLSLLRKGVDEATPDPGQEALREKDDQFGAAGTAHVRWYDRNGGPEAYEGFANVSWEPGGGGTADLESVTVNLTGKGARTSIANPAA
jgi:hypothetical protein